MRDRLSNQFVTFAIPQKRSSFLELKSFTCKQRLLMTVKSFITIQIQVLARGREPMVRWQRVSEQAVQERLRVRENEVKTSK